MTDSTVRVTMRVPDEIDLLASEVGIELARATGDPAWSQNRTRRLLYLIQRGLCSMGHLAPEDVEGPTPTMRENE